MTTRVTTPFTAESTAAEVIAGIDLGGRRAIVTGGSSGIGVETARALASAGAEVTLAVRDVAAGARVADRIAASTGNAAVRVEQLELADQSSIRDFVGRLSGPLDILVDNAGIMATPEGRTAEGWELQFATNHLGHFALTIGLHDALRAAGHARVVVVSSVGHVNGEVLFDDLDFDPSSVRRVGGVQPVEDRQHPLRGARRRSCWTDDGITVNALNPGRISSTNLAATWGDAPAARSTRRQHRRLGKNIEQGAATSVLLAASPLVEGITGRYFEDCQEAVALQPGIRRGVAEYALDPVKAERLWQASLEKIAVA